MEKTIQLLQVMKERLHEQKSITSVDADIINEAIKELKEYEKMKTIRGTIALDKAIENTLINACPDVAKKLKALEFFKVYLKDFIELNIIELPHINKVHYEIKIFDETIYVSKEKYELLKEVLL